LTQQQLIQLEEDLQNARLIINMADPTTFLHSCLAYGVITQDIIAQVRSMSDTPSIMKATVRNIQLIIHCWLYTFYTAIWKPRCILAWQTTMQINEQPQFITNQQFHINNHS
jgi:hypothetical protein